MELVSSQAISVLGAVAVLPRTFQVPVPRDSCVCVCFFLSWNAVAYRLFSHYLFSRSVPGTTATAVVYDFERTRPTAGMRHACLIYRCTWYILYILVVINVNLAIQQ